jgi:Tol biopolymer transport system component
LSATNKNVQPGLERIVRHCLEKNPEERFYSMRDVAFDLEALSGLSAPQAASEAGAARRRSVVPAAVAALAVAIAAAAGYWVRARQAPARPPSFHQLTYRRGTIWGARFGSDGRSVLYSAAWDGGRSEVFLGRTDAPDARPFGLPDADLLAVSSTGEVAVALHSRFTGAFTRAGTLARIAATGGGAPREILEGVEFADFSPDGKDLAIVRVVGGKYRLEYPIGKVLYETPGWIGEPRFSPRGDHIAFLDHPVQGDDGGGVGLVDLAGRKTALTPTTFASAKGLGWSPDGTEVWFGAVEVGGNRAVQAVSLSGRGRTLFRGTGVLTVADVARDGRVLVTHDLLRVGVIAVAPGETRERDLSWFDWSLLSDLSADGRFILFSETGEGGGSGYSAYLRAMDGSPAVRLGEGNGLAMSPDGKAVLAVLHPTGDQQIVRYPTGPGEPKSFGFSSLRVRRAEWLPDSKRFLMVAAEPGHQSRIYLVDPDLGKPKALTPEGANLIRDVDAHRYVGRQPDGTFCICSIDGGAPVPVSGLAPADAVIGPARDGWVYVARNNRSVPAKIDLVEVVTGRAEKWKELAPSDATGVAGLFGFRISPDGRSYAYSYGRGLSDLYVVEGLR